MMYSNGFVVAIKDNRGRVLRENMDREVFLPFGSEYSIFLKNKNGRNAVAEIQVDGTDVLGNRRVIVPANGSASIERFCTDGDLANGRVFRFVEAFNGDVQDPTAPENGLVRVRFWLERQQETTLYCQPPYWSPYRDMIQRYTDPFGTGSPPDIPMFTSCCTALTGDSREDVGATIEGRRSGQVFTEGNVGALDLYYTEITVRMRGAKAPVTVQATRAMYCSGCGAKAKRSDRFCSACGNRL